MKAALASYLSQLEVAEAGKVKGQFLPFGDFRPMPGSGRVLLAGDAAGLVDPITGEGIAHALHSGELAALAAFDSLQNGDPDSALPRYVQRLAPIHTGLRHARRLRPILFDHRVRRAFVSSFRNSRSLRTDYLRMLDGSLEYSDIMRKMALRLPRFAWQAARLDR